jgi:tetratricopeptide (TPR) repeat protein
MASAWAARIEGEHNNIRAALEGCLASQDAENALRLLGALGWLWQIAGHFSEARDWLDRVRRLAGVADHPALHARALNHIGRHSWTQDRMEEARRLLEESEAICRSLGEAGEPMLAEAWNWLGLLALSDEHGVDRARALMRTSLALYKKLGSEEGVALATFNLGIVEGHAKNDEAALALLAESLRLTQARGDWLLVARICRYLGNLLLRRGDYAEARLYFEEHLRIDTELKFWDGIGHAYGELGDLARYQGDYEQAEEFYSKCLRVHYEHGLEPDAQYVFCLVLTALQRGDHAAASRRAVDYFGLASKVSEAHGAAGLLLGQAATAAGQGQPEAGARLAGMAQALFQANKHRLPSLDRAELDRHIQIAREQLGEARFEALAGEGAALTLEDALEYALNWRSGA